jgi:iron-sulfur cluster repair protein YtfE (RIC family)
VPNQPEEVYPIDDLDVSKLDPKTYPTKNLFEHLVKERGFANLMSKGAGAVTTLRTGYDPAEQRLKQLMIVKENRMKEHLQKVREIYGTRLFQVFLERFQQEQANNAKVLIEDNSENRKELERIMHMTQRKFEPNNVTGSFSVMR